MADVDAIPFRDPNTQILSQLLAPEELQDVAVKERRWQWARPQVEGVAPCARGGHTATLVGPIEPQKISARIVVFGGHYGGGEETGYVYCNDTFVLDVDENTWFQPRCRGTPPEARYGHSASLVGTRVVFFGGQGRNGTHFRDLHALDASSMTWYQGPSSGGAPAARHGHTSTLCGTRLLVFGGACRQKYFGDLHCLDLSSMAWHAPETTGPQPPPRTRHAALMVGENLIIHGGFCLEDPDLGGKVTSGQLLKDSYLTDTRILDTNRMVWSRLRTHGAPPAARFGHTLALSEEDVVVFGGWCGQSKGEQGTAFSLKNKSKGEQESRGETEVDYCLSLRTSDMRWTTCKFEGVPGSKRYGHSCTSIGPHLIIFGGWDGGKPLNDLVVLRDRSGESMSQQQFDPMSQQPPMDPSEEMMDSAEFYQ